MARNVFSWTLSLISFMSVLIFWEDTCAEMCEPPTLLQKAVDSSLTIQLSARSINIARCRRMCAYTKGCVKVAYSANSTMCHLIGTGNGEMLDLEPSMEFANKSILDESHPCHMTPCGNNEIYGPTELQQPRYRCIPFKRVATTPATTTTTTKITTTTTTTSTTTSTTTVTTPTTTTTTTTTTTAPTTTNPDDCTSYPGYLPHTLIGNEYCLRYGFNSMTGDAAREDCMTLNGSHLITIESRPMLDALQTFLHTLGHGTDYFWVDGYDHDKDDTWTTWDRKPLPFIGWKSGNPGNGNADCIYIDYSSTQAKYEMGDSDCDNWETLFICQI